MYIYKFRKTVLLLENYTSCSIAWERRRKEKLMDSPEYVDLIDEVVDEDWKEDQVLTRNRNDPFQMIEFKLGYGLGKE
uniref:Uncharacterized protein n=1 Tax=Romanomermis culicivorax TaxID=13658 RepID=A0A915KXK5_ROMCU